MVFADSSYLFSEIIGGLKAKTSKHLRDRGINEDEEVKNLLEMFSHCESPYQQLSHSYQQEK